jgi:putative transposase
MYHIIFVCKYRKKLLIFNEKIIKELFIEISKNQDFIILEMECDKDHIHLLIESEPKVSILQIVRLLKSKSTIELWKIYSDELKKHFWLKNMFWSRGYFACTIGNASENTIRNYIKNKI